MTITLEGVSAPYDAKHEPDFFPDVAYRYSESGSSHSCSEGKLGQPMEWGKNGYSSGRINGLHLNGNYFVRFKFESSELRNWLKRYIEDDPREAMRLLVKMLQLAVDSMDKREEPQEKT